MTLWVDIRVISLLFLCPQPQQINFMGRTTRTTNTKTHRKNLEQAQKPIQGSHFLLFYAKSIDTTFLQSLYQVSRGKPSHSRKGKFPHSPFLSLFLLFYCPFSLFFSFFSFSSSSFQIQQGSSWSDLKRLHKNRMRISFSFPLLPRTYHWKLSDSLSRNNRKQEWNKRKNVDFIRIYGDDKRKYPVNNKGFSGLPTSSLSSSFPEGGLMREVEDKSLFSSFFLGFLHKKEDSAFLQSLLCH